MKFSLVIPVRAINNFLIENIENIKKLEYENFEVMIVLDELEPFNFGDSRFKIVSNGPTGPGDKRNFGANMSSGDILVFLDDDAYPTPKWLNYAAEIFKDENVYALGAPAVTPPNATKLEKYSGRVLESWLTGAGTVYRHIPKKGRLVNDYPTVNLFVRREAFFKVKGFIRDFWPGEDTKLCLDLVKEHDRFFVYDPRPVVYHHRRRLFKPHLKQISRYGMHRGQFARIYPENSRNISYFIPSVFVLGLLLGPLSIFFSYELYGWYLSALLFYLGIVLYVGIRAAIRDRDLRAVFYVSAGIIATHIVYGLNFLVGLIKRPKLQLRGIDRRTGSYLGG